MRVVLGATSGLVSGVDVFSANLARGLRSRGVEALVLLSDHGAVTTHPMPFPGDIPTFAVSLREGGTAGFFGGAVFGAVSAGPTVYLPNYDWSTARWLAPRLPDHVRIVGSVHSDDPVYYRQLPPLAEHLDAIVAVSRHTADCMRSLLGGDPDGIVHRIPYGVPATGRPPEPCGAVLRCIYVGRLVQEQKRVLDLVEIVGGLRLAGVSFRLDIVGDGDDRATLERRLAPEISGGLVRFHGTVPNAAVQEMLRRSDVLLLTSEYEGLPVSLLEAAHAGTIPVVTRTASGAEEVVRHGETGFLVPIGDRAAFVEILRGLAADPDRRDAMRQAVQRSAADGEYTVDSMTAAYLGLFEDLMQRRPRGSRRPIAPASTPPPLPLPIEARVAYRMGRIGRRALRPLRRTVRRAASRLRR